MCRHSAVASFFASKIALGENKTGVDAANTVARCDVRRRRCLRKETMTTPYGPARTGTKGRDEITKILRRFGCESIGFEM